MKKLTFPTIYIMAELDWNGLHCQSHYMAKRFAEDGHDVVYINRTLQRWPKWNHLKRRIKYGQITESVYKRPKPDNLNELTLWVGPPVSWLRWLNRRLIARKVKPSLKPTILITYVPTYNCIDLKEIVQPNSFHYLCYHNFDADIVLSDVRDSERLVIKSATKLFADSLFLVNRLVQISHGKTVVHAPPGVNFDAFYCAFRGNEIESRKKICFFGGAGKHVDIETYNELSKDYHVIFIAQIADEIGHLLSPRIEIRDVVGHEQLPEALKEMDILSILYLKSDYIDGVIPAKFFECMGTGKPVLVSGLDETLMYSDLVYDVCNSHEKAKEIIEQLPVNFPMRLEKQLQIAKSFDFESLYQSFKSHILK